MILILNFVIRTSLHKILKVYSYFVQGIQTLNIYNTKKIANYKIL